MEKPFEHIFGDSHNHFLSGNSGTSNPVYLISRLPARSETGERGRPWFSVILPAFWTPCVSPETQAGTRSQRPHPRRLLRSIDWKLVPADIATSERPFRCPLPETPESSSGDIVTFYTLQGQGHSDLLRTSVVGGEDLPGLIYCKDGGTGLYNLIRAWLTTR